MPLRRRSQSASSLIASRPHMGRSCARRGAIKPASSSAAELRGGLRPFDEPPRADRFVAYLPEGEGKGLDGLVAGAAASADGIVRDRGGLERHLHIRDRLSLVVDLHEVDLN